MTNNIGLTFGVGDSILQSTIRLYIHLAFTYCVGPSSMVSSELNRAPPFPQMKVLEVQGSQALNRVCLKWPYIVTHHYLSFLVNCFGDYRSTVWHLLSLKKWFFIQISIIHDNISSQFVVDYELYTRHMTNVADIWEQILVAWSKLRFSWWVILLKTLQTMHHMMLTHIDLFSGTTVRNIFKWTNMSKMLHFVIISDHIHKFYYCAWQMLDWLKSSLLNFDAKENRRHSICITFRNRIALGIDI